MNDSVNYLTRILRAHSPLYYMIITNNFYTSANYYANLHESFIYILR